MTSSDKEACGCGESPLTTTQRACLVEVWQRGSSRRVTGKYSGRTYNALLRKGLMENVDGVIVVTEDGAMRAKACR